MRTDIISNYGQSVEEITEALSLSPGWARDVTEFCLATRLKLAWVTKDRRHHNVRFTTNNGYYAGTLRMSLPHETRNKEEKYIYSGPLVCKDKSSATSGRDARDSKKLTGLISALKRDNAREIPTDASIEAHFPRGASYAFKATEPREPRVSFNIEGDNAIRLVENFLGKSPVGNVISPASMALMRTELEESYQAYMDKRESYRQMLKDRKRFDERTTVIGIQPDKLNRLDEYEQPTGMFYVVAEASYDRSLDKVTFLTPFTRYSSLADSPVAADAAIIRTFMQGRNDANPENELMLPWADRYLNDLDIAIGYQSRNSGMWVVIPKVGSGA